MILRLFITSAFLSLSLLLTAQEDFTEQTVGLNMSMVFVEGGTFTMGCTNEQGDRCRDNESPSHLVKLDNFYIGKYPVTQRQYEVLMDEKIGRIKGCPECPVENVNWFEAKAFVEKLSELSGKKYRLPTEAEWEFVARGGNKSNSHVFSGSNDITMVAWYNKEKVSKMQPVGIKSGNELGIYDMSGNVWEWCNDIYTEYDEEKKVNPDNSNADGRHRVIRGGSWMSSENMCRVSARHRYFPSVKSYDLGFRVVKEIRED